MLLDIVQYVGEYDVVVKSYLDIFFNVATKTSFPLISPNNSESEEDLEEKEEERNFILFDSDKLNYLNVGNLKEFNEDISSNNFKKSTTFLYDGSKFRRILKEEEEIDKDTIEFSPIEKQFIQVELIVGDKEIDIHHNLKEHYLNNNTILDKEFLIWFLNFYDYDVSLKSIRDGDYVLKIIDKNVEMFDLQPHESIILSEDDCYKRIDFTPMKI